LKWRTTPFPWFDDVSNIVGDSVATGRYSFLGGNAEDRGDNGNPESPVVDTPSRSELELSRALSIIGDLELQDPPEDQGLQTQEPDVTREPDPKPKRKKVSGVSIMERMGDGIVAMAEAMKQSEPLQILQGSMDSTTQEKAQAKVQEEMCLTEAGQLYMIDRFRDSALARTYLGLKKESLRLMWLKSQVGDDEDLFIDWTN
jgi:hypothetical protein